MRRRTGDKAVLGEHFSAALALLVSALLLTSCGLATTSPPADPPGPADTLPATDTPEASSTPASQEAQWVLAQGGEGLAQDASWRCMEGVEVVDDKVVVEAWETYVTVVNRGLRLDMPGDVRISATLEAAADGPAALSLFGALPQGQWWQGIKRLDVSVEGNQVTLAFWDGTNSAPAVTRHFFAAELPSPVQVALGRVGEELYVWANGAQVGRLHDPGAFPEGQVYLGANVSPRNKLTIHSLSVEAAAGEEGSIQVSAPVDTLSYLPLDPSLRALAQMRGMRIGAAASAIPLRCERIYAETLAHEFNTLTPENAMKFGPIHPARERYDFRDADEMVAFAEDHDMLVYGHALVWHEQLPEWLTEAEWTGDELTEILREHIATVVGRYRGRVVAWDVVNEGISGDGSLRDTVWLRAMGSEYIDTAFRLAHEADPDALLFYSDYACEGLGRKSDAIYDLVRGLVERGVPIDGVGLQMHVPVDGAPSIEDVRKNIERLGELGLLVRITEMDVRIRGEPTETELARQASIYGDMMRACLSAENCTAFTLWGFTDRHSWIPAQFPGWGSGLILDELYRPKPAYDALREALAPR